jgi:hypothetical protein
MADDDFKLLIETLGGEVTGADQEASKVVRILIQETVKFRDKLKEATGQILTVADARVALQALEYHVSGQSLELRMTPEQQELARIYIDRLTLFKN